MSRFTIRDLEYENSNKMKCDNGSDYGFPCKNFKLCGSVLPDWWWECKSNYICLNCDIHFGTWGSKTGKGILDYSPSIECPVCMEEDVEGMSYPNCNHLICINCLRRCIYGKPHEDYPSFPYDENVEEEFDRMDWIKNADEFFKRYPLLRDYYPEYLRINRINDLIDAQNSDLSNLCPLCRQ